MRKYYYYASKVQEEYENTLKSSREGINVKQEEFKEIEMTIENIKRCSIFFCSPYSSFQKGACEKNHEYIRMVLPKETSFDSLDQNKINLIMSNINSIIRHEEKCSPFDRFYLEYGNDVLDLLNIKKLIQLMYH